MDLLCIETSTQQVSVALGRRGTVIGEVRLVEGQRHAEQLAPAIQYLQNELHFDLAELTGIGVGLGPGLFTGLRVGITTARVLAQALRVPIVGVPTLDLLSYPLRYGPRLIASVLDARRGEIFYAIYQPLPGGVQRIGEYRVGPPEDLIAELSARGEEVILAGDGARRYRRELEQIEHSEYSGHEFDQPSIASLVKLADARFQREEFQQPSDISPIYLRKSDAEINADRKGA